MIREVTYAMVFGEAITVCRQLGTWVIYAVRDADQIEHLVGYFMYRIEDLRRRRDRNTDEPCRKYLAERASQWSRACRMIQRLRNSEHVTIANKLIHEITTHPEHAEIPYLSSTELEEEFHTISMEGKTKQRPPNRNGRPRLKELRTVDFRPCGACKGLGMFPK